MPENPFSNLFGPLSAELKAALKVAAIAVVVLLMAPPIMRALMWSAADRRDYKAAERKRKAVWK